MESAELRAFLKRYGLAQDEFAKMIGASLRSVSSWLSEAANVPGPAEAYTRVFAQLSEHGRQRELLRAKGQESTMRDGVFLIDYSGAGAWSSLTLDQGTAYGFDLAGGTYDGTYAFDAQRKFAEVELRVSIPPNAAVVWGPAKPYEWSFSVNGALDPNADAGTVRLTSSLGGSDIEASYRFMRSLPSRPSSSMMPSVREALDVLREMSAMRQTPSGDARKD